MLKNSGASGIYPRLLPPFVLSNKEQCFYFTQKRTNSVKRERSEMEMIGAAASSKESQPLLFKVNVTRDHYCIYVRFCLFNIKSDSVGNMINLLVEIASSV